MSFQFFWKAFNFPYQIAFQKLFPNFLCEGLFFFFEREKGSVFFLVFFCLRKIEVSSPLPLLLLHQSSVKSIIILLLESLNHWEDWKERGICHQKFPLVDVSKLRLSFVWKSTTDMFWRWNEEPKDRNYVWQYHSKIIPRSLKEKKYER